MTEPLDPNKPLWLNDGTPVEYLSHREYHIVVRLPYLHPARRQQGSNSHQVTAHRNSFVLTHNHAFTLTNEDPNTMSKFNIGDRVEYTGKTSTHAVGKQGVVTGVPNHVVAHSLVRFDGGSIVTSYADCNLTLIAAPATTESLIQPGAVLDTVGGGKAHIVAVFRDPHFTTEMASGFFIGAIGDKIPMIWTVSDGNRWSGGTGCSIKLTSTDQKLWDGVSAGQDRDDAKLAAKMSGNTARVNALRAVLPVTTKDLDSSQVESFIQFIRKLP